VSQGSPLTCAQLRALFARRVSGERTADLATEVGTSVSNLQKRWRRIGCSSKSCEAAERAATVERRTCMVWRLRREGWTYYAIASRIGLPADDKSLRRLRTHLLRWCQRNGIEVPGQKAEIQAPA
jgi:hypothetical protein